MESHSLATTGYLVAKFLAWFAHLPKKLMSFKLASLPSSNILSVASDVSSSNLLPSFCCCLFIVSGLLNSSSATDSCICTDA